MIDTKEIRYRTISGKMLQSETLALCDELDTARAEIDRLRAPKPKPQGKTVRVKVAVAVDKNGKWVASGHANTPDEMNMASCIDFVDPGEAHYWLTADLPIPEEMTVEAEVDGE